MAHRVCMRTGNRAIRVDAPAFMRGEERFSAPGKSLGFDHALQRWQCQGLHRPFGASATPSSGNRMPAVPAFTLLKKQRAGKRSFVR